tara:strand:- start:514 stop:1242 length:729 start_codon:yes stop_codon:yes gene_type:complete
MASIEDLIAAYTLGSVSGLDTRKVGQNKEVNLKDPSVYTDTAIEDVPLPDDLIYVTRGEGLDKKRYVGNKDRNMNFLKRAALGVLDAIVDNTKVGDKTFNFDWDRQNLIPEDEYNAKRLAERRRKADLSGDALPSPEKTRKRIESQKVQDAYLFENLKKLNDYELERFKNAYPQYAKMINDEIYKRRMQIELNSPSEIMKRYNASRKGYVDAVLGRAQAQKNIADAVSTGLFRHSGIRNVAG